jgi:hypothetical protein
MSLNKRLIHFCDHRYNIPITSLTKSRITFSCLESGKSHYLADLDWLTPTHVHHESCTNRLKRGCGVYKLTDILRAVDIDKLITEPST